MSTAPVIAQRQQIHALEGQITQLRGKLVDAEDELARLKKELTRTAEQIALDREKPEKINDISRRIEQCDARIAGFKAVIGSKDEEIRALAPRMREIEEAQLLESRRAEMQKLIAQGKAVVERINGKLREIIQKDLIELDSVRDRLQASDLNQLGGGNAATELCRVLTRENGQLCVDHELTNSGNWMNGEVWRERGDIVLHIRNLVPPRK